MAAFQPYDIPADQVQMITPGLKVYFHERGTGALPKAGQRVTVHYHGVFQDGRVFDSSFKRGDPFSFVVGKGQVIRGWDDGLQQLPVGSKAALLLEPDYAYGRAGASPTIPHNTPLVFYVEVISAA